MAPQALEQLVQKIYELQTLMVAASTGETRIQERRVQAAIYEDNLLVWASVL